MLRTSRLIASKAWIEVDLKLTPGMADVKLLTVPYRKSLACAATSELSAATPSLSIGCIWSVETGVIRSIREGDKGIRIRNEGFKFPPGSFQSA